ncbi:NADP-reducing hydrogenase subunit HndA [Pseudovibrio axinellae]|uniref:NADP-reducing hydrogenase subunit HndA n=1 Tax=Pseudovibrio axinellae TaxID=989403 RepID=A0A165SX68_9HYPH|nr:formate dehydrogenase subunit gamma [Pseudovibrio axinellae]KZL04605.1 NADP-reducing hydrogenase subunit HndA [Pseudovibrio axinellae]SEQ71602.1 formate dehydrogenase gamma subunit [Pseudovibrio axinellae]
MALQTQSQDVEKETAAIVDSHEQLEGPLLPILHDVQAKFGYIPEEALLHIADRLNLSRAEVYGTISFYHDFRKKAAGRHVLKVCRSEACQSVGGDKLAEGVQSALGITWHETTDDGMITLEPVYCLGLCACAPAAMLDEKIHGRLDKSGVLALVEEVK